MKPFHILLRESAAAHGHLCPGQVVGVRMAMLGCRLIGLPEPTRRDQIKNRDHREVYRDGRLLCLPCTEACYFTLAREITWPEMNWSPKPRGPSASPMVPE
jgi:formylmethanofuran dehydrogenase subunit E